MAHKIKRERRPGQHKDETPIEYLRRLTNNSGYEYESFWDDLPSVEACLEYFELWHAYDTEYWAGIYEAVLDGDSPAKARAFLRRWGLKWTLPTAAEIKGARAARSALERK